MFCMLRCNSAILLVVLSRGAVAPGCCATMEYSHGEQQSYSGTTGLRSPELQWGGMIFSFLKTKSLVVATFLGQNEYEYCILVPKQFQKRSYF